MCKSSFDKKNILIKYSFAYFFKNYLEILPIRTFLKACFHWDSEATQSRLKSVTTHKIL